MDRPNILVFLCDQMRRHAMSHMGDPNVRTPNLDWLAERGVRFDAANSTFPVCVPYRFSMLTGEYAHSRIVPAIVWRMSPAERTIAHEMNEAGYETAWIGKWHLYGAGGKGNALFKAKTPVPRSHQGGFQRWWGFELRNEPFDTYYFVDDDPTPKLIDGYQTDGLTDLFLDYIRSERDATRPFFSVVSVEPPHPPFVAPQANEERMRDVELTYAPNVVMDAKLPDQLRTYYAMIENIDDNIGRILDGLRAEGLLEKTVIVFTSDHGELLGAHGLRSKQHPYEESVGVPLIVYSPNPDWVRGGRVVDDPTATEDIFPTLRGLAGLAPSPSTPGADLSPIIRGEQEGLDREGVLLEFVIELRDGYPYDKEIWRAFRTKRYKYTTLGPLTGAKPWQLFDLENDPYEMNNLIDDPSHAAVAKQLHGALRARIIETGDHYALEPAWGLPGLNLVG